MRTSSIKLTWSYFFIAKRRMQDGNDKRELIQFMDELVELASEENKTRAILVKEKLISDFEKSYEYEKEVQTEVSYLPPYYIAAMPDDVQEEIKQKVIAALTEHGECTPENIENAMCSKIYDLEDLIDIREYVERMEEEQRKNRGRSRNSQGGAADDRNRDIDSTCRFSVLCIDQVGRNGRP